LSYEYQVASLTKPIVAHAIRKQIKAGKLHLNTAVADVLERDIAFEKEAGDVTIQQLLQHTGGHSYGDSDPLWIRGSESTGPDCRAAAEYVARHRKNPGGRISYSNAGYCLLGEVLKKVSPATLDHDLVIDIIHTPLGAAGGWVSTLPEVHAKLRETFPLDLLEPPPLPLVDGSWYAYGWRWWPEPQMGAQWTHTGRLPGLLAVALADGTDTLMVAHFQGDPPDFQRAAAEFGRSAWPCMSL